MAARMVSFVFKVLIMTVLIGMFVTFAACLIDVFVTTTRIQSLAQMMQFDIAQNNCLLNDTYEGFQDELYSISTKSSYMKVCCQGDVSDARAAGYTQEITNNAIVANNHAIELYANDADASQDYIQTNAAQEGVLAGSPGASGGFTVANYGDILTLSINTCVNPRMWGIGGNSLSDNAWFAIGGRGGHLLTLNFSVPALTYIK